MPRGAIGSAFSGVSSQLSLVAWWPLRFALLVAVVIVAVLGVWRIRRKVSRAVLLPLGALLLVLNLLLGVNAYYGYVLTLGQAFGFGGPDQSMSLLRNRRIPPPDGVVAAVDIPGESSRFQGRTARVYVPPAWFHHPRPRLPVIEMLHGVPGAPSDWIDAGEAKKTADAWAAAHGGVAPIMVMPDVNGAVFDDSECVNSDRGQVETYLTEDVPNFMRSRFFTRRPGKGWALAGLSEGGSCSIMLGLRHPRLYSTIADYGGLLGPRDGQVNDPGDTVDEFFGGSREAFLAHEPANLLRTHRYPGMHVYFGVGGADDQPLGAMWELSVLTRKAGMTTRTQVLPGGEHTFDVWRDLFAASLPWMDQQLQGRSVR